MEKMTLDQILHSQQMFVDRIKEDLGAPPDLVVRQVGSFTLLYINGMVDLLRLEEELIGPLSQANQLGVGSVNIGGIRQATEYKQVVQALVSGFVVIASASSKKVLLANLVSTPNRGVQEPQTEAVIRGPREGFSEPLEINMALIRRRLKSDKLRMKYWHIGTESRTEVRLLYLQGIAQNEIVEEVARRISNIRIDGVLESNYIEEMIRDHPVNLLPTVQYTERPDAVVSALLEGKVAIVVDNSPMVLILPMQFWSAFQSSEDYYSDYIYATFIRIIRSIFVVIALVLPSLYVAITTFHQEMLPTNLLFSVAAAREATPFPALIEALMMEITFEALREAGVRLPRPVGQAVSIVGALVIGEAAVQAGIVSAPMVIVVSVTGIASFTIPRFNMSFAIRILRFPLIILAGTLGLFGIVFGLMALVINMTGIRSVGVPYMTPLAPLTITGLKDLVIRAPIWKMNQRPAQLVKDNQIRVPYNQPPMEEQPFDFYRLPFAETENGDQQK